MGPWYVSLNASQQARIPVRVVEVSLSLITPPGPCVEHASSLIFNSISYLGRLILIMININMIESNPTRQAS